MTTARYAQVSLDDTPYYHCISRCVRRAFLCGDDPVTGQSFEHRRGWVEKRLLELPRYFAIDVCAYAVMSNHTHVVLHVDTEQAGDWALSDIVERWHGLFLGTLISQRFLAGASLTNGEQQQLERQAEVWRERLLSVSWFMRCLNEPIARQANEEDGCSGRFWEGRFKSQALLDEAALAACLAYVDLNPVRAGMAETPDSSEFTSIQRRVQSMSVGGLDSDQPFTETLTPFVGNPRADMPKGLPFTLEDYLQLVDWTGRAIRDDKKGFICAHQPRILERLQIDELAWLQLTTSFEGQFSGYAGCPERMTSVCERLGVRWLRGIGSARRLLNSA